jgi:hypothetical protein
MLGRLAALLLGISPAAVHAELLFQLHNNTALSGGGAAAPIANLGAASAKLGDFQSATLQGQLTVAPQWAVFSVEADRPGAFVRLWVDDHLMLDEAVVPVTPAPAPTPPQPRCPHPGGAALPSVPHWKMWQGVDLPTSGTDDPHSMRGDGGDCTSGCSLASCVALCDKLRTKGCVGFVTAPGSFKVCYMRKLQGSSDSCEKQLHTGEYDSYTRDSCINNTSFCPPGTPAPVPAPPKIPGVAAYAIPVPFLPGLTYSKVRVEITTAVIASPVSLTLKINGTAVPDHALSSTVAAPELKYHSERALAERGWNTWLSGDMLTHALLPHGIAVSMALHAGSSSVSELCSQGPSCDLTKFPAKHGLHATRGEYTELETVSLGDGTEFRVETAASENSGSEDLNILITTLALPNRTGTNGTEAVAALHAVIALGVPEPYEPRVCTVTAGGNRELWGDCPGLSRVRVSAAAGTVSTATSNSTLQVALSTQVGGQVAVQASALGDSREGGGGRRDEMIASHIDPEAAPSKSSAEIGAVVGAARAELLKSFAQYGVRNETFAGMQTSISWNVIYTP